MFKSSAKKEPGQPAQPMSVRRSLVFSFARKYTNMLLTVPTIMIVSRLLTPSEVGVYSIAMAFVALVHTLRDFGVSDYLVQVKVLNEKTARSAFAVNVAIAWTLGLLVFLCSGLAGWFFNQPGLETVVQILSINFFLLPFGSTVQALLKRSMQFGIIYKVNLAQQATQSGMTVLLTYLGFSYYGLAWGSVAGGIATIIACFTFGNDYRIRGFSLHHWRDVANFGVQRTSIDVLGRINKSMPDFVIGRVIDTAAVGLYSRGKGLINMFRENVLGAIGIVTFPSYSRMHRGANNAHVLFAKSLAYITAISWPFVCFVALLAYPIMRITFGEQWDAAVPILQIFCISTFFGVTNSECSRLFIATGKLGLVTRISFITISLRLAAIIPAAYISLLAVVAIQIPFAIGSVAAYYWLMLRHTDITTREMLTPLRQSFVLTCITMALPCLAVWFSPPAADNLWLPLCLSALGAAIGWFVGVAVARHPMGGEVWMWLTQLRARMLKTA